MTVVALAEIADQIRGVSYGKKDVVDRPAEGFLPVLRANNITDDGLSFDDLVYVRAEKISSKQQVRSGDIVIAASSGSISVVGKAAQADDDLRMGFGAFCKVVRPSPKVHARYIGHFFRTQDYRRRMSALAAGANINNLKNEHIDEIEIPLPPLDEQKQIAAILDQADELRRKRQRAIDRFNQLGQAIFHEMFSQEISKEDRTALGDLVDDFRYGTSNKSNDQGYPTLRIPNVVGGAIDSRDLKTVPLETAEFKRLKLIDGDVLFVRTNGNPGYVGRSAVFTHAQVNAADFESEDWAYASYLIRARLKQSLLNPWFLQAYLSYPEGRKSVAIR